jgi:hypothetical protein
MMRSKYTSILDPNKQFVESVSEDPLTWKKIT